MSGDHHWGVLETVVSETHSDLMSLQSTPGIGWTWGPALPASPRGEQPSPKLPGSFRLAGSTPPMGKGDLDRIPG
jgi:hypothetical protein